MLLNCFSFIDDKVDDDDKNTNKNNNREIILIVKIVINGHDSLLALCITKSFCFLFSFLPQHLTL